MVALHSIIGTEPWDVIRYGEGAQWYLTNVIRLLNEPFFVRVGTSLPGDPLLCLESQLKSYRVFSKYVLAKPALLNGGAVGYISYDCVRYYEPRSVRITYNFTIILTFYTVGPVTYVHFLFIFLWLGSQCADRHVENSRGFVYVHGLVCTLLSCE